MILSQFTFLCYELVVTHPSYETAQDWLLEDEYERVNGQLLAEEVFGVAELQTGFSG
jgi:hypothetical protein